MTSYGSTVFVATHEEYEKLLARADSLSGWYDPRVGEGQVLFSSPAAAIAARREL